MTAIKQPRIPAVVRKTFDIRCVDIADRPPIAVLALADVAVADREMCRRKRSSAASCNPHLIRCDRFSPHRADVSLVYCSGAPTIAREVPGVTVVSLPPELAVGPDYGMVLFNIPNFDLDDVRDKAAALLVARRHDARRPIGSKRLTIYFVGDHDILRMANGSVAHQSHSGISDEPAPLPHAGDQIERSSHRAERQKMRVFRHRGTLLLKIRIQKGNGWKSNAKQHSIVHIIVMPGSAKSAVERFMGAWAEE